MSDHRHRRLLRMRGERPRDRAAEKGDELAPAARSRGLSPRMRSSRRR